MGIRRKSREFAMQALFYMDTMHNISSELIDGFCENFLSSQKANTFTINLIRGVIENREEIDTIIERFSSHWKIGRMPCVDRNVLRIAVFELLFCQDIPPKVSINEAIDIGKRYGTEESGAFINGILDTIRIALEHDEIQVKRDMTIDDTVRGMDDP